MTYSELLDQFSKLRVLVVGDLMLDAYIFGHADRVSPEAPVLVLRKVRESFVPGGAANVARNLRALGAEVSVVGIIGDDEAGSRLREALGEQGLVVDPNRPTTLKTRIVADHSHQVLRIDDEQSEEVSEELETELMRNILSQLSNVDVVLISDYMKGCLTEKIVRSIVVSRKAIVVANPKPRTANWYRGANLLSLNRLELSQFAGLATTAQDHEIGNLARTSLKNLEVDCIAATLGASGILAISGSDEIRVPAEKIEVYDTAGAGDTAIATLALGYVVAGFAPEVFQLAAKTSGAVVAHVGVVAPSTEDLAKIRAIVV